jgi:glucose-1-phosphate thymidylyltransferase
VEGFRGLIETTVAPASHHGLAELAPIANRPLISYALGLMLEAGVREVAVVGTVQACEQLRRVVGDSCRDRLALTYVKRPEGMPAVDAIAQVEEFAAGASLLVHPGRALVHAPLGRLMREFRDHALDAVVIAAREAPHVDGAGPAGLEARRMSRLLAQVDPESGASVDTGVRLLGPRWFEAARTVVPGVGVGDGSGTLTALVAAGGRVGVELVRDWWAFDGSLDSLLEGNRQVLDRVEPRVDQDALSGARIQGRARIHPSARIESSTIRGPVIVGAGADVRSAYIGPYTAIGDGVQIRGAEIENSIVLPRAQIEFIGRRIEASIVGADARISRDFSLPKAVRLWIGDHAEVCLT